MTDSSGGTPPFGAFSGIPGFSQTDMMGKMWELMRLNPFTAAAMPGGAQGVGPSLSMMSDMLAPLSNIEELDKRVTDMRAIEQWLKLNLNMLQSAIQALEVQRATLATLRAFGAYAQSSVEKSQAPAPAERPKASGWPMTGATAKTEAPKPAPAPEASKDEKPESEGASETAFDPSGWWNLLQTQFNQLAGIAMAQAAQAAQAVTPAASAASDEKDERPEAPSGASDADADAAAKKAPAKKAPPRKKSE
ncbi:MULTISPECIES: PhaM family polyhydroxyalkanoate granule multifunctional regulatory protein [unclassified Caballeronia]|uniref:PhaM family polyhydroxyalkanoate granule multifunctional regulatory protein n=1 Tax=unclassified Caballeronia TaxID=2646786 RepID=UPI002855446A|nr:MULTISPECIES: PhaM family polyhydroxyalkanoate granule multifunctional regulatory protein [unclassified Caballeronia]MDR5749383.1 alginate biosynthesis protein AlgP [Caballeronia sp. LZ024]MDR5843486.1 alginate biosynthesis protein AlgP [Caballeronia sp. LZ031]